MSANGNAVKTVCAQVNLLTINLSRYPYKCLFSEMHFHAFAGFVRSKQAKIAALVLIWLLVFQIAVFIWLGHGQNEHRFDRVLFQSKLSLKRETSSQTTEAKPVQTEARIAIEIPEKSVTDSKQIQNHVTTDSSWFDSRITTEAQRKSVGNAEFTVVSSVEDTGFKQIQNHVTADSRITTEAQRKSVGNAKFTVVDSVEDTSLVKEIQNHVTNDPRLATEMLRKNVEDTDFAIVDSVSMISLRVDIKFVLVIPRKFRLNKDIGSLDHKDRHGVRFLGDVVSSLGIDGATCLPRSLQNIIPKHVPLPSDQFYTSWRQLFNSSWCNFARRDWSIQIRNTGLIKQNVLNNSSEGNTNTSIVYQLCNIINGPFLLRKDKFVELKGLEPSFGRLTILDFFLRSKGKLKIAKVGNCFLSDDLFHIDRAELEGSHDFPDYSNFGAEHDILRIIMEDKIEWTRCTASGKLCKEEPYTPPTTLPQIGQPICCKVILSKMLKDITDVFVQLDVKNLIIYGTLLGAVRSKTIIPWTHDADISLERHNANNLTFYAEVQKYLLDKYYIGNSFMNVPRMVPLIPIHINIITSGFFKGDDDLQGDDFFSRAIRESVRGLIPIYTTSWRERGYVDFYTAPEVWWNGSSNVVIDGHTYHTLKEIDYELKNWYGNYKVPALRGNWNGLSDQGSV